VYWKHERPGQTGQNSLRGPDPSSARYIEGTRYPLRDRVMILLSTKAGLRAKEIAMLEWGMVTDAEGTIGDVIHLENRASKGRRGGRTIPVNTNLREALVSLKAARGDKGAPHRRVIHSERADGYSAAAVQVWFWRLYGKLGFAGASSHSGRRTFITRAAKKIIEAEARCATSRSSPVTRASRRRSGTFRETRRRSGRWLR
jgi:integrase/recombinase XerC